MIANRNPLTAGAFGLALLTAVTGGVAFAQDYRDTDSRVVADPRTETVIVRPDRDYVQHRTVLGHVGGAINPEMISITRSVDVSDLDLTQIADRDELEDRVHDTALDLCAEITHRFGATSQSDDRECVSTATRDAMNDVRHQLASR